MNTMIPNTFNSVQQNAAITQGLSAFQTGGPHNTVVTQMARRWAGRGSDLLKTHSVEHHDGAAVSLTARDGVPNYHNDTIFTSTPFGRGNDKNFFSLFCERRPLIGRRRARSRNMLRPLTKRYFHTSKRKAVMADIGGSDDGLLATTEKTSRPRTTAHPIHFLLFNLRMCTLEAQLLSSALSVPKT